MTTTHHAGWSSLPSDLLNRVADCLLATNDDLDWYMDLRAVCHTWRSATADPRTNPGEPRFHPRSWATLDEDKSHQSRGDDGTRLFVNTATGRFLRRRLHHHVLGGYYLVTSTPGGFLVLAERSAPHAALVVNPFTGAMTRFVAPVPCEVSLTAAVVSGGSSADPFTLVLACDASRKVYWAGPESEAFLFDTCAWRPSALLPYLAALYAARMHASAVADTDGGGDPLWSSAELKHRAYAVASTGGEILVVHLEERSHHIRVYKKVISKDDGVVVLEQVASIGNHALFVGNRRCLLVDADKLPSVQPNCVYCQL